MKVVLSDAVYFAEGGEWLDITIHLSSRLARLASPGPAIRTMTIGCHMYTEYPAVDAMPVATFYHEIEHVRQWLGMSWPRTPNFLLNKP